MRRLYLAAFFSAVFLPSSGGAECTATTPSVSIVYPANNTQFTGTADSFAFPMTLSVSTGGAGTASLSVSGGSASTSSVAEETNRILVTIGPTTTFSPITVSVSNCAGSSPSASVAVKYNQAPKLLGVALPLSGLEPGEQNDQVTLNIADPTGDSITAQVLMWDISNPYLDYLVDTTLPNLNSGRQTSSFNQTLTFSIPETLQPNSYDSTRRQDPVNNGDTDTYRVNDEYIFQVDFNDGSSSSRYYVIGSNSIYSIPPDTVSPVLRGSQPFFFVFKPSVNSLIWPLSTSPTVNRTESSTFAEPRTSGGVITRFHAGLDLVGSPTEPILARAKSMIYVESGKYSVAHTFFTKFNDQWASSMTHTLEQFGQRVVPGMVVLQGTTIATVGNFDTASPVPYHLHFANEGISGISIPRNNVLMNGSPFNSLYHPTDPTAGFGISLSNPAIIDSQRPYFLQLTSATADANDTQIMSGTVNLDGTSGVNGVNKPINNPPPYLITGDHVRFRVFGKDRNDSFTGLQGLHHVVFNLWKGDKAVLADTPYEINFRKLVGDQNSVERNNVDVVYNTASGTTNPTEFKLFSEIPITSDLQGVVQSNPGSSLNARGVFNSLSLNQLASTQSDPWGNYMIEICGTDDNNNTTCAQIPALNSRAQVTGISSTSVALGGQMSVTLKVWYPSRINVYYVYMGSPAGPVTALSVSRNVPNGSIGTFTPQPVTAIWNGTWDPNTVPPGFEGKIQPGVLASVVGNQTLNGRGVPGNYKIIVTAENNPNLVSAVPMQPVTTINNVIVEGAKVNSTANPSGFFIVDDSQAYSGTAANYGNGNGALDAGEQPKVGVQLVNDGNQNEVVAASLFPMGAFNSDSFLSFPSASSVYQLDPGVPVYGGIVGDPPSTAPSYQYISKVIADAPLGKKLDIGVEAIDGATNIASYSSFEIVSGIDVNPAISDYGHATGYAADVVDDSPNLANGTYGNGNGVAEPGELVKFQIRSLNDGFSNIKQSLPDTNGTLTGAHALAGMIDNGGFNRSTGNLFGFKHVFNGTSSDFSDIQNKTVAGDAGKGFSNQNDNANEFYTASISSLQNTGNSFSVGVTLADNVKSSSDAGSVPARHYEFLSGFPMQLSGAATFDPVQSGEDFTTSTKIILGAVTIISNGPSLNSQSPVVLSDNIYSGSPNLVENVRLLNQSGNMVATVPMMNRDYNPPGSTYQYQELFQSSSANFTLEQGGILGGPVLADGRYQFDFFANDQVPGQGPGGLGNVSNATINPVYLDVNPPAVSLGTGALDIVSYDMSPATPFPAVSSATSLKRLVRDKINLYGIACDYFLQNYSITMQKAGDSTVVFQNSHSFSLLSPPSAGVTALLETIDTHVPAIPDGDYSVILSATDFVGHTTSVTVSVEVDNTLPTAVFNKPGPSEAITKEVDFGIEGTTFDKNIDASSAGVSFFYVPGIYLNATPPSWNPIPQNASIPVKNRQFPSDQPINTFDSSSLTDGFYTMRMTVTDLLLHSTEVRREFRVDSNAPVIQAADSTTNVITYSITKANKPISATVSLYILKTDLSGSITVRSLEANQKTPVQDSLQAVWDGKDDSGTVLPDGPYQFLLQATDEAGNEGTAQGNLVKNGIPTITVTSPNFSTPFNVSTGSSQPLLLQFTSEAGETVSASVVTNDSFGVETAIATLLNPQITGGQYTFAWDGKNLGGSPVQDGTYTFKIQVTDTDLNQATWDGFSEKQVFTTTGNDFVPIADDGRGFRRWSAGVTVAADEILQVLLNVQNLSSDKSGLTGVSGIPDSQPHQVASGSFYSIVMDALNPVQGNYENIEMAKAPGASATFLWDAKDIPPAPRAGSIAATNTHLFPVSSDIGGRTYSFVRYDFGGNPVSMGSVPVTADGTPPAVSSFTDPAVNAAFAENMVFSEPIKSYTLFLKDFSGQLSDQQSLPPPSNNFGIFPGTDIELRSPLEAAIDHVGYAPTPHDGFPTFAPGPYTINLQLLDAAGNTATVTHQVIYQKPVVASQGGVIVSDDKQAWLIVPPQNGSPWATSQMTIPDVDQSQTPAPLPGDFVFLSNIYDIAHPDVMPTITFNPPAMLRLFYYDVDNDGNIEFDINDDGKIVFLDSANTVKQYDIATGAISTPSGSPAVEEQDFSQGDLGIAYFDGAAWNFLGGVFHAAGTGQNYIDVQLVHASKYALVAHGRIGKKWYLATPSAFDPRTLFGSVVFNNKIFVVGGKTQSSNTTSQIFSSVDGFSWVLEVSTPHLKQLNRAGHVIAPFLGQLWAIGGFTGNGLNQTDVCNSPDGIFWTSVGSGPYGPRNGHALVPFNNELWLIGGNSTGYQTIYHSTDGTNWTAGTVPPFDNRVGLAAAVFNNKIWVAGGQDGSALMGDVWNSNDGSTWTPVLSNAPFGPRRDHQLIVFNGEMWLIGGTGNSGILNDVWDTTDGTKWTKDTGNATFDPRTGFGAVAFNNRMWVFGGSNEAATFYGDSWYSPQNQVTPAAATPTIPFTDTPTVTPTVTNTPTPTITPTNTPTFTATPSPTETDSDTPTRTRTDTATDTETNTRTDTPTATPSETPTETFTETFTITDTSTPEVIIPRLTRTLTPTPTVSPTPCSCGGLIIRCVSKEDRCGEIKQRDGGHKRKDECAVLNVTIDGAATGCATVKFSLRVHPGSGARFLTIVPSTFVVQGSQLPFTTAVTVCGPGVEGDDLRLDLVGEKGVCDTSGRCREEHFMHGFTPSSTFTKTPAVIKTDTPTATTTKTVTPTATSTVSPTVSQTPTSGGACDGYPCNLRASVDEMKVSLWWDDAENGMFKHPDSYHVYRGAVPQGPFSLIAILPADFGDKHGRFLKDFPGRGHWCYAVKAFKGYASSDPTNMVCVLVPSKGTGETQDVAMKTGSSAYYAVVLKENDTPTCTSTPGSEGVIASFGAGPNISFGNQPVHFFLTLNKPAEVVLRIFALDGEQVYSTDVQASTGDTILAWQGENNDRESIASGLYFYVLRVRDGTTWETRKGKIALIH